MGKLCILICLYMVLVDLSLAHPPWFKSVTFEVEVKATLTEGPHGEIVLEQIEQEKEKYQNCADVQKGGFTASSVYTIYPDSLTAVEAYCDLTTNGGRWTVFQNRMDGSVDFYRMLKPYEDGFGNPETEYWLGLIHIRSLVLQGEQELRVDLEDWDRNQRYAEYSHFSIDSAGHNYELAIDGYTGDAEDGMKHSNGIGFSAKDRDLDSRPDSCAINFKGAWWYNNCHDANLNGQYLRGNHTSHADGVNWEHWKGNKYSLKKAQMKMRPVVV